MSYWKAEYVWIGGDGELRSKIKVVHGALRGPTLLECFPEWNYDGSSTGQADGKKSEIILVPRAAFGKSFSHFAAFGLDTALVVCDTYEPTASGERLPTRSNHRVKAVDIFDKVKEEHPWYGMEQEYFLIDKNSTAPLGTCLGCPLGYSAVYRCENAGRDVMALSSHPSGDEYEARRFYCSVGTDNTFGRTVAEEHLDLCIRYGIKMSGMNAEVAPGQWEFQVGPCEGIEAGDHMIAARYLLLKIAEAHNVGVSFHPKPVKGSDMNGSGCHTNFSTANMRTGGDGISGLDHIYAAIGRLKVKHEHHMARYGEENDMRLTGANETESYDKFTHGIGDRGASVRIGNETLKKKCGYFEDRRPAANCDPYLVTQLLCSTCLAAD